MSYSNLPVCCNQAIADEVTDGLKVFDGQIIECPKCQRGIRYTVATGWRRYWRVCDRCDNDTSFMRHDESEPREGEYCQRCGNWLCPDCVSGYDSGHEGNVCLTCAPKLLGTPTPAQRQHKQQEWPVYFERENDKHDAPYTGGVHFFCSNHCRSIAPTAGYGTPVTKGIQPTSELAPGTICETCGTLLTEPEGVAELREFAPTST